MDPMEIMMEMMACRRLEKKTRKNIYSSLLGYNVSRKTSSLISLTRNSQFFTRDLHSSLVLIRLTRPSILQRQLSRA
jgi:hypothetical protein